MKAYEIRIIGWKGMRQIVAARSSGHARSGQYQSAKGADYDIPFVDFRAKRARDFDNLAAQHAGKLGPIVLGWEDKTEGERWGCLSAA